MIAYIICVFFRGHDWLHVYTHRKGRHRIDEHKRCRRCGHERRVF